MKLKLLCFMIVFLCLGSGIVPAYAAKTEGETVSETEDTREWYEKPIIETLKPVGSSLKDLLFGEKEEDVNDLEEMLNPSEDTNTEPEEEDLTDALEEVSLKELKEIDPMSFAKPFQMSNTAAERDIKILLASMYHLCSHLAVFGLLCSFMVGGIRLLKVSVFHRPGEKEEILAVIGGKVLAFSLFCTIVILGDLLGSIIRILN